MLATRSQKKYKFIPIVVGEPYKSGMKIPDVRAMIADANERPWLDRDMAAMRGVGRISEKLAAYKFPKTSAQKKRQEMIAVDTNLLVYAHRADMPQHEIAREIVSRLVEGDRLWGLPWPCVHEFFSSVTRGTWKTPTLPLQAWRVMERIVASPSVQLLGEGSNHLEVMSRLVESGRIKGAMIHDARIAAICISHGINELWTSGRDFSLFPELKIYNPFEASHGRHRH